MNDMESNGSMANGATPSQANASGTSPAPSAVGVGDIAVQIGKLSQRLEQIERNGQSVKDKRIAGLQGDLDSFKTQLGELRELMAGGMSEAAALRLMSLQPTAYQPVRDGNPQPAGDDIDVAQTISVMGLDANDAQVLAIVRNEKNPVSLVARLASLAANKRTAQPAPIPAAQAPAVPATPAQGETEESMVAELDRLLKNPSANMPKIRELRRKLTALQ